MLNVIFFKQNKNENKKVKNYCQKEISDKKLKKNAKRIRQEWSWGVEDRIVRRLRKE